MKKRPSLKLFSEIVNEREELGGRVLGNIGSIAPSFTSLKFNPYPPRAEVPRYRAWIQQTVGKNSNRVARHWIVL